MLGDRKGGGEMYKVWVQDGIGMHAGKMLCAFVSDNLYAAMQVQSLYLKRGICARIESPPSQSNHKEEYV